MSMPAEEGTVASASEEEAASNASLKEEDSSEKAPPPQEEEKASSEEESDRELRSEHLVVCHSTRRNRRKGTPPPKRHLTSQKRGGQTLCGVLITPGHWDYDMVTITEGDEVGEKVSCGNCLRIVRGKKSTHPLRDFIGEREKKEAAEAPQEEIA